MYISPITLLEISCNKVVMLERVPRKKEFREFFTYDKKDFLWVTGAFFPSSIVKGLEKQAFPFA